MGNTKYLKIFIISICAVIILAVGILAGFLFFRQSTERLNNKTSNNVEFINPTVTSNLNKRFIINFKPLKDEFIEIQKKYSQKTYIYFVYLNNSSWVGLGEKDLFAAASTIKVPLAMSIYKMTEEGKLKTSDKYSLEELDLDKGFGELYKVGPDKEFTVEELIKIMLEQSDNTAKRALDSISKKIGIDDPLSDVYAFFGWEFNEFGAEPTYREVINLKILSNMFLSLYNAAYINAENSNKILSYLVSSPFNEKIVAGVPKDIQVPHKIGIATLAGTFSDCGIVYAPNRNYILCIGFNGGDEKTANKFMAEISKTTYQYVINN